jgi:hypothetical protein
MKRSTTTPPLHSPVCGGGMGGASSTALKICLIKTVKRTPETKMSDKIFCKAFLIYFQFYKKGSFNPQAVRIRVKLVKYDHIL